MSNDNTNMKVQTVHFAIGLDLIGSKTSLHTSKYEIIATPIGIQAKSRSSGRTIVVPYSNVKGFELLPESGAVIKSSASSRTEQALKESQDLMVKRGQPLEPTYSAPVTDEAAQLKEAQEARKAARQLAREQAKAKMDAEAKK